MSVTECVCGGSYEHFDTLKETATQIHIEVKCDMCNHITDIWLDQNLYKYGE